MAPCVCFDKLSTNGWGVGLGTNGWEMDRVGTRWRGSHFRILLRNSTDGTKRGGGEGDIEAYTSARTGGVGGAGRIVAEWGSGRMDRPWDFPQDERIA